MKKYFLSFIILFLALTGQAQAQTQTLHDKLSGRILLQVDHRGEAWWIHPVSKTRYFLRTGELAYEIMRKQSLGIKNADLAKIPTQSGQRSDAKLVNRLKGRILLAVEDHGKAWYLDPVKGVRHYLKDGEAALEIMKSLGLGISDDDLRKIPINNEQVIFDHTFDEVAHVKLSGNLFSNGFHEDKILPLASLSKLMTALVVLDQKPDWNKKITFTQDDLDYPLRFVDPGDATSEVPFEKGDTVTLLDLWRAMLVSSSNQSAGLLAKNVGLTYEEFIFKMNKKAKELNLQKTIFTDPSGLDPYNISTAKEMALLAKAAYARSEIADITVKNFTIAAIEPDGTTREFEIANRNYSLLAFGVDSAKTGFLYEAQRNVALKKNGTIIVVLHARSMNERNSIIEKLLK